MKEKQFFICSHGHFCEAIVRSAEMIIGPMPDVKAFPLLPGMSVEEYLALLVQAVDAAKDTICLVDLFGGTPCNSAMLLSKTANNQVVTGVNLAILLEMYMQKDMLETQELVEHVVEVGQHSVKNVMELANKRAGGEEHGKN